MLKEVFDIVRPDVVGPHPGRGSKA
jgi:hypothetical protein